ncbi:hypothetical protein TrCOL_g13170, partial [Triparma columacea]
MRFTDLTALTTLLAATTVTAAPCSETCSTEFVSKCVSFQSQGYQVCRDQIDTSPMPAPLSNAGCVKGCEDTDAMAATKNDDGDDTSCTLGAETFVANEEGSPSTLCSEQVCSLWSDRGTAACKILVDVPTTCAGKSNCPIIFFFHGAGGKNTMWAPKVGPDIHDGVNSFIGIYPQGVDSQWNTGS